MTSKQIIRKRVKQVRSWMKDHNPTVSVLVIPTMDPHDSEYVAEHWQMRRWLTGFTGSAGLAVLTSKEALLWTDSRYWLQAKEQLAGTPFRLMREGVDVSPHDFLSSYPVQEVAFPEDMMTPALYEELFGSPSPAEAPQALPSEFLDFLWKDRPPMPYSPVEVVPEEIVGESAKSRIRTILNSMRKRGIDRLLVSDLSEICWLLNIRARDIPYNPYPLCFLLLRAKSYHTLYIHRSQLSIYSTAYLRKMNVIPAEYKYGLKYRMQSLNQPDIPTLIPELRAVKNPVEQEGFRTAHLRDGVAMVRFLRRLDESKGNGWTELSAARLLESLRREQPGFMDLSFETISAYGPHSAVVHYEPTEETDVPLTPANGQTGGQLLLVDSGAHYDCGTTDITRTVALGEPTDEERRVYTLVLRGHLKLMHIHFPEGTNGLQLDTAARMDMWREGYDFGHGTGHGVGFRSGVHEGPAQIRKDKRRCTEVPFVPGQVITDEPGIYVTGRFGVRIENMLICQDAEQNDFGHFLRFENLTLCPYDRRLIDTGMLTAEDCNWINAYHQSVREKLLPILPDPADREWLTEATRPL